MNKILTVLKCWKFYGKYPKPLTTLLTCSTIFLYCSISIVLWKVPQTINNTSNLSYHFLILFNINSWITRFLKLLNFKEYNFTNLHMVSLLTKLIFLYCINSNEIILVKNKKWILNFACSRKKTFAF